MSPQAMGPFVIFSGVLGHSLHLYIDLMEYENEIYVMSSLHFK